jgi:hypothetical protein
MRQQARPRSQQPLEGNMDRREPVWFEQLQTRRQFFRQLQTPGAVLSGVSGCPSNSGLDRPALR